MTLKTDKGVQKAPDSFCNLLINGDTSWFIDSDKFFIAKVTNEIKLAEYKKSYYNDEIVDPLMEWDDKYITYMERSSEMTEEIFDKMVEEIESIFNQATNVDTYEIIPQVSETYRR